MEFGIRNITILSIHYGTGIKNKSQKSMYCLSVTLFKWYVSILALAEVTKRKSTSFGVMTIHQTQAGMTDPIFQGLHNPFYAIDSRDYQVVQPKLSIFKKNGAKIISLEKIRVHRKEYERAIMGVRFSEHFVGLQFHPEADALSFIANLKDKEKREKIIAMKGRNKFRNMLEDLVDDQKIYKTNETIIPNFLRIAINDLMKKKKILSN
ncbi:MAG: hypothetical protein U5K51_08875 [Flavobacteriaceae bacterium]|nr:hypothetical protein [Flavobacteriaceae bacterium]